MRFTHLRLCGFKSFVEPTDLPIEEGLTGIVGPNGCGKSNLVEALRWVMGENSPRRMRGSGMDDVIFGGTTLRPARNLAEVSLAMDNSLRTAMAEYNDADDLLVTRRIERGSGSDYRVNGRPVRQRDVQLLFADQSTGAQSTSVIGQGQIDALIRAKPQDRRQILEEASGTAGLAARRHEAELKLKAAEQNLTRVDDVLKTLDVQLRSLKQQVRQASRYRNLAEHIRRTEAGLLHLRWIVGQGDAQAAREALQAAQEKANDLLATVTCGTTERTEAAAGLPELRQAEAAAAAVVQGLTLTRERLEAEAARIADATTAATTQKNHAESDLVRERAQLQDSINAMERLEAEQGELAARLSAGEDLLPELDGRLTSASEDVAQKEEAQSRRITALAEAQARTQGLAREIDAALARQAFLAQRRAEADSQRAVLVADIAARGDLTLAATMVEACEKELTRRKEQAEQAQNARCDAEEAQKQARALAAAAEGALMKKRAERDILEKILAHGDDVADQVIDLIVVSPGLEKALAVALGETLSASLDPASVMHWRAMEPLAEVQPLPSCATPLSAFVEAPDALARSLAHIGLVETRAEGEAAASRLMPGQILVSRDGWAWRWDGFTLSAQAQTASALRLEQRNRLASLREEVFLAEGEWSLAQKSLDDMAAIVTQCQTLDQQTRESLAAAFAALADARDVLARQERDMLEASTRLGALDDTAREIGREMEALQSQALHLEQERGSLPDVAALEATLVEERLVLAQAREILAQRKAERDSAAQERARTEQRLAEVVRDLEAWHGRADNARKQMESLNERIAAQAEELARLADLPAQIEARRGALMDEMGQAETKRAAAADALIAAESALAEIERRLKADEAALASAREDRVRAEAAVEAAEHHLTALRERAQERLSCVPENLAELAAFKEGDETDMAALEALLARYVRERDGMGPVNLRAEAEAKAAEDEMTKLTTEKDDLAAAIGKLRHGIGQLNREARERLGEAFAQVNENFQKLFTGLFGGGKAYLELIDNDDPMNAGLEIFAAPPGKKQQVLSLLSGGERTLTALALVFAVFQTRPSPICVLDEAEAALDEGNIGRFCDLVQTIGQETGTRFLIVTHQRLTMAKMDRLFGVTMGEKGVSQIVSVDLAQAVAMREKNPEESATESLKAVQAA